MAIIGSHDAMILPHDANPGRINFSERTAQLRLGIETAAKSPPDGYTLLLADMPHTIAQNFNVDCTSRRI
jgi:hypothetical protein